MSLFTDIELALFTPELNLKRYLKGDKIDVFKEGQMATITYPNGYGHGPRTHNESIALNTIDKPIVKVREKEEMRIRKLVPLETAKLMGFSKEDYQAMRNAGMSDSQIYHCCGDSIVTTVLMGIFGNMFPISEEKTKWIIENYIEELKES
jgi:site-specific DNA-cytosine methylase